jgi:hypothetical protein
MENVEKDSEENFTKIPGTNEGTHESRPPPIILTSEANMICLQREIKRVVGGEFFRNTATGTRITTKRRVAYKNSSLRIISTSFHFTQRRINWLKPLSVICQVIFLQRI